MTDHQLHTPASSDTPTPPGVPATVAGAAAAPATFTRRQVFLWGGVSVVGAAVLGAAAGAFYESQNLPKAGPNGRVPGAYGSGFPRAARSGFPQGARPSGFPSGGRPGPAQTASATATDQPT